MKLKQSDIHFTGHAIEFRITAEDMNLDFRPQTGTIEEYLPPSGPGVRVDSHLFRGYERSAALRFAAGKADRLGANPRRAIARGRRALDEFVLEGLPTTIPFHKRCSITRVSSRRDLHDFLADHIGGILLAARLSHT